MSFSFFSSKRGVQMTMQLVVGMVIALAILVILIVIFTGKAKTFAKLDQCEQQGNKCMVACGPDQYKVMAKCPDENEICCEKRPNV